jgi:hypothetical protein
MPLSIIRLQLFFTAEFWVREQCLDEVVAIKSTSTYGFYCHLKVGSAETGSKIPGMLWLYLANTQRY